MKRRKNRIRNKNRMAAFLAAVLMTALCLCQAAFAAERTGMDAGIDTARPVSLTIDLEGEGNQATLSIYRAGSWDGSRGAYLLDGDFAGAGIDLSGWTDLTEIPAEQMEDIIKSIKEYAQANGLQPLQTLATEGGKLQFTDLAEGLYFITQGERNTEDVIVASSLISLPMWNKEANTWDYSGTIRAKHDPGESSNPGGNNGGPGGGGGGRGDRDTPGGGGDPATTIGDPDPALANLENIADEDVPLATNPILQAIEDVLVPLGLLPKTADGSVSYTPLLTALAVSGALIILLVWKRRKRAK